MRRGFWSAAMVATVWAVPAAAVHTEPYDIPYFGVAGNYLVTDGAREAGHGEGIQLSFGVPLDSGNGAVELRFFDSAIKDRFPDGKEDYQTGLFVDYVRDFGTLGAASEGGFLSGIKPFASLGVGFIQEDVLQDKHLHLGLSAAAGLLVPLGWNGWALRLDGRVQPQSNSESVDGEDFLLDYGVNLGVQMPLTWFYDRPVPLAPAEECPLAVVDPATGRRDCATDSDGDGVGDSTDHCPGTPAGTAVDARGCPPVQAPADADGDGVPDTRDECPGTQAGLRVDYKGCVIAQKANMRGVTFEANSATLTAEGRATLEGVAATLREQEDLQIEIAGHTDSVGSEAFNTLLSQQRADAVRAFLITKGVGAGRLTAVGYGELEPIASNDTEEGRQANRRVEFRISTE